MTIDIDKLPERYQRQILEKLGKQQRPSKAPPAATEPPTTQPNGMSYHFTIYGDPRTKKNHQQILGAGGKCPACGKPQKQWIGQSATHGKYEKNALSQITGKPDTPIDYPVNIRYLYYMQTRRRVDLLNLMAATDDILSKAEVIADDNSKIVAAHDGSRVYYDKENPRVEIDITTFKEEL